MHYYFHTYFDLVCVDLWENQIYFFTTEKIKYASTSGNYFCFTAVMQLNLLYPLLALIFSLIFLSAVKLYPVTVILSGTYNDEFNNKSSKILQDFTSSVRKQVFIGNNLGYLWQFTG